jgi:hypothetical protein
MATATITDIVTKTLTVSGTPTSTMRAPNQGGILEVRCHSLSNPFDFSQSESYRAAIHRSLTPKTR